jgi:hypothetical protein
MNLNVARVSLAIVLLLACNVLPVLGSAAKVIPESALPASVQHYLATHFKREHGVFTARSPKTCEFGVEFSGPFRWEYERKSLDATDRVNGITSAKYYTLHYDRSRKTPTHTWAKNELDYQFLLETRHGTTTVSDMTDCF